MQFFPRIAILLALLMAASCAAEENLLEREPVVFQYVQPPQEYHVGPGDVLRVVVVGHPELSSPSIGLNVLGTPVDNGGRISVARLGHVDVNDLTAYEIEDLLTERFNKIIKRADVSVAVVEKKSHRIFVVGEVVRPGPYYLDRNYTAMEALSLAGGLTTYGNRDIVSHIRGGFGEDYVQFFSVGQPDPHAFAPVIKDDVIFVSRRKWANVAEVARDLLPLLQAISLPVAIGRDVALFEDIRSR